MLVDTPFTAFARSTLGAAIVGGAGVTALVAVLAWFTRPHQRARRVAAAAAMVGPAFAVVLNVILGGLGVWQSTLYTLPQPVLAATGALALALGTFVMLLSGYRWLARRSKHTPLIYSLLLLVVLAPLIGVADTFALSRRYIAFGHGYTIWMDAVVGMTIFALPVLAFELLRRRRS